ncbi:DUF2784 domain-containing protein [Candidatus Laterigemmans baculatus]|uniref:DUF2784 domain-containing protein n=1 Tax=Candidatus Laterigemmans baculatus TaxID=2770505 RepID=UPI0013DA7819|nr:DUF2784 domain-containing protein [Candidatus Laterigemmans baculatus]
MLYRGLADAVLLAHLAFVLFVVLGSLLVLRWPRLAWLHMPAAIWGVIITFAGWPCPLTPLEKHLRRLGGEAGYEGGFIDHYLTSILYPSGLSSSSQTLLGIAVLLINASIYGYFFYICAWKSARGNEKQRR